MNARKRFTISSSIAVFTFGIVIVLSIIFTFFVGFTSELASNVKALLFSTLAIIFVVSLIFFLIGIIKMNRNRRKRKKFLKEQIENFIRNFPNKIREIKNRIDRNFNDAGIEWFKTNMAFRSLIDNILEGATGENEKTKIEDFITTNRGFELICRLIKGYYSLSPEYRSKLSLEEFFKNIRLNSALIEEFRGSYGSAGMTQIAYKVEKHISGQGYPIKLINDKTRKEMEAKEAGEKTRKEMEAKEAGEN